MKFFKPISKLMSAIIIISTVASSGIVLAENPTNINVSECDDANRLVTVSGTVTTSRTDVEVVLTVLKKDVAENTFENTAAEAVDTVLSYFAQKPLEADGSFSFTFKLAGESGDYIVLIDSNALVGTYSTTLSFTNTLWDELKALKDDTTDGSLQRFKSFIEAEAASLAIGLSEYSALSDDSKNIICTTLKEFSEDYTAATFAREWDKNVIWAYIDAKRNEPATVASMVAKKNTQGSSFFNNDKITFFLNNFSETAKTTLYSGILANEECDSLEKFVRQMQDNLIVTYVQNTAFWKNLYTIIEAENNVLEFNPGTLATFGTLNNKDAVVTALYTHGQGCTTSAQIISLFDTLVAAQKTEESKPVATPKPPKGGGGGSSWSVGVSSGTMPEADEPEEEIPEQTAKPAEPVYDDISGLEWAKPAIEYLTEKEILAGVGDGKFEPNRYMTREELIKMLDNYFGYSETATESNFVDADKNAWYYPAVSGAATHGIIKGYADGTFGIGNKLEPDACRLRNCSRAGAYSVCFCKQIFYCRYSGRRCKRLICWHGNRFRFPCLIGVISIFYTFVCIICIYSRILNGIIKQ